MNKRLFIILEMMIVGLLVFTMTVTGAFLPFDHMMTDMLYQTPRGINSRIKIIGIDEKTLAAYGPVQTWSRSRYADLIRYLNQDDQYKPMVIGFDILFSGYVEGEGREGAIKGDLDLAETAKESGNVVVVNHLLYAGHGKNQMDSEKLEGVSQPYSELADGVDTGYDNVAQDTDGTVRRILPEEEADGVHYDMFSRVIYEKYCARKGIAMRDIPTDKSGRTLINFSGKPGDYECVSLVDVLEGRIDPRAFAGSVILVGAYATGMQDNFKVPNGGSSQMYGVEVHANILQSFIDGRFAVNGNPALFGLITALLAMLLHLIFRKCNVWLDTILLLGSTALFGAVCIYLNGHGKCFSLVYFPIVAALSFVYALTVHYLSEKARKKSVLQAFQKYVAPQVVEEIAKTGDFKINLGGENRDIAVLFVDIRGFTTMSEAMEPEQVVEILNEYLGLTTKAIFDHSGTLDKFVGDATMAVFNSPFDLEDYEYKAVLAALDIVKGGEKLEEELMERFGRSVGFGVGVNCGPAVVGNVGCEFRMDFTAIGDTVNTAARLEANAKKGQVLISDVLYERLKDRLVVNEIGQIPLKGKSNGVNVFEVLGVKTEEKA